MYLVNYFKRQTTTENETVQIAAAQANLTNIKEKRGSLCKIQKMQKKTTKKKKQLAIKNKYMKPNIFSNDNEFQARPYVLG